MFAALQEASAIGVREDRWARASELREVSDFCWRVVDRSCRVFGRGLTDMICFIFFYKIILDCREAQAETRTP